ncbi:MAG: head completion/stabilization protein [Desulforhopalus sp.]
MSFTGFADDIAPATTVENAAFWPALDLAEFQSEYRLPGEYRQEMLENRLKLAMIWANSQLNDWKLAQVELGYADLDSVVGDDSLNLGSEKYLTILYVRAVSCHAKALLLSDYKTMLRKSDAQNDAKESEDTADKWFQIATDAINDIRGNLKIHAEAL